MSGRSDRRVMGVGLSSVLAAAAVAALSMPAVGGDVEVLPPPRPRGLGEWMTRNNKRRRFRLPKPQRSQLNQRLGRATGQNSYGEWKAALAAERAKRRAEGKT